jgi:hypothetical protein
MRASQRVTLLLELSNVGAIVLETPHLGIDMSRQLQHKQTTSAIETCANDPTSMRAIN